MTNGAVKSSEIKILRLKDSMFSTNAMNFSNDNDFTGWYTKSAKF